MALGRAISPLLALEIAFCVLATSPPALAAYLFMETDETAYDPGESIVVTLYGEAQGLSTDAVFVELLYSAPELVDGVDAVATQTPMTSLGSLPWTYANPPCAPDGCVVLNQLAISPSLPPDPGLVTGTLTIPAVGSGLLTISPGEDSQFFSAEIPAPVTVIVGGQEVDSLFTSSMDNFQWSELTLVSGCGSFSAGQVLSGGNPGAYRRTDRTCSGSFAPKRFYEWEVSNFAPSLLPAGRSLAVAYCEDGIALSLPAGVDIYSAVAFWQSGTLFAGPPIAITSPTWQGQCQGLLVADDFVPILGSTPAPDFSAAGGTIRFGHLRWVEGSSVSPVAVSDGIDNYSITFVPEPKGVLGVALGAIALAALSWRSGRGPQRSTTTRPRVARDSISSRA